MICNLCPRKCGAERSEFEGKGFCKMGTLPVVAKVAPHFGEEPCISGVNGSGTIFFSGCTLKCVFCQNYDISANKKGKTLNASQLADCYKELEQKGVHNINLVTADHFVAEVAKSFEIYKPSIPIVYNCSGYTSLEALKILNGIVDIYLPDFKYSDNILAKEYSSASIYVETAVTAIKEMISQVGTPQFDDSDMMTKGVIVRHLILPSHTKNSIGVLDIIKEHFDEKVLVSLMCQYVPFGQAEKFPKINRKITKREYEKVKNVLFEYELDGFTQDLSSADTSYIPSWDF